MSIGLRLASVFVLVVLSGCGGPSATDAGVEPTDVPIVIGDVPRADTPMTPDVGDGPCATLPPGAPFTFLPASCLPRCTAATRDAFALCAPADRPCIVAALEADPTPDAILVDEFGPLTLTCGTQGPSSWSCYDWQSYACSAAVCPTEYDAYLSCLAMGLACTGEGRALTACANASPEFLPCQDLHVAECFAP